MTKNKFLISIFKYLGTRHSAGIGVRRQRGKVLRVLAIGVVLSGRNVRTNALLPHHGRSYVSTCGRKCTFDWETSDSYGMLQANLQ